MALPLEKMNPTERRIIADISFSLTEGAKAMDLGDGFKHKKNLLDSNFLVFIVESDLNEDAMNYLLYSIDENAIAGKLDGRFYQVAVRKEKAVSFILRDEVKRFELSMPSPLLNYSNPAVEAPYFYEEADYNGIGTSVCIADTGIDVAHGFFAGKTFENINCEQSLARFDEIGHGTHVAGIVASIDNNYTGIAKGVDHIVNAKGFLVFFPFCLFTNLKKCFDENRSKPAQVANNSWGSTNKNCGGYYESDGKSLASIYVDYLANNYSKLLVFAAGNEGPYWGGRCEDEDQNSISLPSDAYNVISVSALDINKTADRADDVIAPWSSRGPAADGRKKPDLSAPGGHITNQFGSDCSIDRNCLIGIISAIPGDNNETIAASGTSMAAPHVTGAAALLIGKFNLNWLQAKALLINSADDWGEPGWDINYGWGYLNLKKAYHQGNNTIAALMDSNYSKHYYRGNFEAGDKITVVWPRHCNIDEDTAYYLDERFHYYYKNFSEDYCAKISDIDLRLYDENGNLVSQSLSKIDNVEQVVVPEDGQYILIVNKYQNPKVETEHYALASSKELEQIVDVNDVALISVDFENTLYQNRTLVGRDFNVIVNVWLDMQGDEQIDKNLSLFVDGFYIQTISSKLSPRQNNLVVFQNISINALGDHNILVSIDSLPSELLLEDNNLASSLFIDGNAVGIESIDVPLPAYKGSRAEIIANVFNRAPWAVNATLQLMDGSSLLHQKKVVLEPEIVTPVSLYSQTLTKIGVKTFEVQIKNVANDYKTDNKVSVEIYVNPSLTPTPKPTRPSGGGGGGSYSPGITPRNTPTMSPKAQETPKDSSEERVFELTRVFSKQSIPKILQSLYSNDELTRFAEFGKHVVSTKRKVQLFAYRDGNGKVSHKAKVTLSFEFNTNTQSAKILEIIPKSIANDASVVTSNEPFKVVQPDPVLEFYLAGKNEIVYYVNSKIDENAVYEYQEPVVIGLAIQDYNQTRETQYPTPNTQKPTPTPDKNKPHSTTVSPVLTIKPSGRSDVGVSYFWFILPFIFLVVLAFLIMWFLVLRLYLKSPTDKTKRENAEDVENKRTDTSEKKSKKSSDKN
ncbi:MAG: S8 family peptidase [Candidatus Diapherotrites archaeon]|nr:S8 family peptidase [Candidatus Diapherotrites archaeon]